MSEHDLHQRLTSIEGKIDKIEMALIGDGFGNSGYGARLTALEQKQKEIAMTAASIGGASGLGSGGAIMGLWYAIKTLIT
jgi:hypothetical protein